MDNLSEADIEELGIEDGNYDKDNDMPYQASYGSSVDLDELTDEQREAYEQGYMTGAEDYDLDTEDDEEDW